MKRWTAVVLVVLMSVSLSGCGVLMEMGKEVDSALGGVSVGGEAEDDDDGNFSYDFDYDDDDDYSAPTRRAQLDDDTIESLVVLELYDAIGEKYDTADPGSCRYSINKKERSGGSLHVYGSVTLYDKYGKTTGGWRDGSGTAFRTFEMTINEESARVTSCKIK